MDKKLLKGFYSRSLNEYGYLARKRRVKIGENQTKTAKIENKEENEKHRDLSISYEKSEPESAGSAAD